MRPSKLLNAIVFLMLTFCAAVVFAQATTTSTVVTIDSLLRDGQGTIEAFRVVGILGGISALVNGLVNLTKFGPINEFIVKKGWKWLRPILAFIAGTLGGVIAGMAEGMTGMSLVLYVVGGTLSGGGAIALHELFNVFKGNRSA